ncbi:ABC transporter permease subunit [uncultured Schumannella sp.]|uniref:ABC transporter permease subunit n=1 Tax=uncultured Schumannella sp. TaxID=1195956 RepID=UPI0025F9BE94|nr:ABC transporter permease subunit [uncultured Schumannella sp.]
MTHTAETRDHVDAGRRALLPVFRRAVLDSWRSTLGWAAGLAAAVMLYLPLYPSIGTTQMMDVLDSMPPELIKALGYEQIGSGAGYTQATIFGLIGFALLTIAATTWSSAAIAGAEESGRLELMLGHAVSRVQYALESTLALVVRLAALIAFTMALILVINDSAQLELEPVNVLAASLAFLGLTVLTASVGLAVGAVSGRRAIATASAAGVAIAGYVMSAIGNQSADLEWLHRFSPYDWAYLNSPLTEGFDVGGLGLLFGLAAVVIGLAVVALDRRDVTG